MKTKYLKRLASATVLFTVASVVSPATAASYRCLSTPALANSHLVESKTLGSGVSAQAWRWMPGADAESANLSQLGTKVSVVSANLRKTDLGVLHSSIPQTQDLRTLSYSSFSAVASINGDYTDGYGPWNAMVEDGNMIYAPPGQTGVFGEVSQKVDSRKGYRVSGKFKAGLRTLAVTGVNQTQPGANAVVVYKNNFIDSSTPKGQISFLIKNGVIFKIYPKGASVSTKLGSVVQVWGDQVANAKRIIAKTKAIFSLGVAPVYETRFAADTVTAYGSLSSKSTTLNFDSINFSGLSASGATLFDENFGEVTRAGKVTIRLGHDLQDNLVVKNVYRQGYFTRVDSGGFIIQANGSAASTALMFRAGDIVTLGRSYRSKAGFQFITAAGRGPRLVENGKFVWSCELHSQDFRPRTAIGWNEDGQIWFITSSRGADADDMGMRQGGSSSGQMGMWLMDLGATNAVLLDGGGSTTMEIRDPDLGWQRFDLPDSAWYRGLSNGYSIEMRF